MSGDVNLEAVAETETVELDPATEIERLAALAPFAYEAERQTAAEALGVRVSVLDRMVNAARKEVVGNDDGDLGLFDPEPWPDEVDGPRLLADIVDDIRRYIVMSQPAAEVVALWTVHTHAFACFRKTPRLHITAPEKGCGKSTLLDVLACLTLKAVKTENLSTAVFFRVVDKYSPTLLIDEIDTFLRDNEELRGALNAGHAKGGRHFRCEGDNNDIKGFKTFAPAALADLGDLPPTLADRSIQIFLQKRLADEPAQDFRDDLARHLEDRASQIARWVRDHKTELRTAEPELPTDVINRLADNWRPLVAIADAAGGDWPERARDALALLRDDDEGVTVNVMALADMWGVFEEKNAERLATSDILTALNAMEDRPWPEWKRGKELSATSLSRLLKKFKTSKGDKIKPKSIRLGDKTPKGYERADIADAYQRYVKPPNAPTLPLTGKRAATPQHVNKNNGLDDNRAATHIDNVAAQNLPKSLKNNECCGVAAQNTHEGTLVAKADEIRTESGADEIPAFMRRCTHCGRLRTDGNPVQEVHCDGLTTWLHRECRTAWLGATDTAAAMAS